MTRKKKIFIGGSVNIFTKAMGNAAAGLPISLTLNVIIAIPLVVYLDSMGVHPLLNAMALAVPFFWASAFRMWVIDLVYEKYNVQISQTVLMKRLFKGAK